MKKGARFYINQNFLLRYRSLNLKDDLARETHGFPPLNSLNKLLLSRFSKRFEPLFEINYFLQRAESGRFVSNSAISANRPSALSLSERKTLASRDVH